MLVGIENFDAFSRNRTAFRRYLNFLSSRKIIPGNRTFGFHQLLRCTASHHLPAVNPGTGADIHNVIRSQHRIFVVLYNDNGIANVSQMLQSLNKPGIIPLVQANAGFIEDIENAHQRRTDLGCQTNALGFPTGKGAAAPGKGNIIQPDIGQKTQAIFDFLQYLPGNKVFSLRKLQAIKKCQSFPHGKSRHLVDILSANGHRQAFRF